MSSTIPLLMTSMEYTVSTTLWRQSWEGPRDGIDEAGVVSTRPNTVLLVTAITTRSSGRGLLAASSRRAVRPKAMPSSSLPRQT
jgi:hypothetical protein